MIILHEPSHTNHNIVIIYSMLYTHSITPNVLETMKRNHMDYFMMCHSLASKSEHRSHHGSIVLHRRSRIVGRGCNQNRIHAEVSCVKNIPKYYNYGNLVVYVCRVNPRGGFMNSRPCEKCMEFMKENGVSKVYFSDEVGFSKIVFRSKKY